MVEKIEQEEEVLELMYSATDADEFSVLLAAARRDATVHPNRRYPSLPLDGVLAGDAAVVGGAVVLTRALPYASGGFSFSKKPPRMAEKIRRIESPDSATSQIMWKCRSSRSVTLCRPPPGGAHELANVTSWRALKNSFFRS